MNIQYPKGETVWVGYYNKSGECIFILTSKPARDFYFLYEVNSDGSIKKLGKAKEPPELERKFNVHGRMSGNS